MANFTLNWSLSRIIRLDIPDHVDPQFRFMLTPCSGDVDPLRGVFSVG